MFVVDAQVHIWGPNTPERPWPAVHNKPHREVAYGTDELVRDMDEAGVNRAVIVPPSWEGERNDLAFDAVKRFPGRFAIMGRVDPEQPDRERLRRWREQPGMKGLRFTLRRDYQRAPLLEGRMDWIWEECDALRLPVMVMVALEHTHLIEQAAGRFPNVRFIMDHCALSSEYRDDEAFKGFDNLIKIAHRPNIGVKVSALPCYTTDKYPFPYLQPYIRKVYDAFGAKRMFWGTDVSRLPCTYRQAITHFTEELPFLTAEDKEWVMGRALCEWLEWPIR